MRVRLRGPRSGEAGRRADRFDPDEDEDDSDPTERGAVGVVVSPGRVLVLDLLDARRTARIEAIDVFDAAGEPVSARFVSSYRDYGAILVEPARPLGGALALDRRPVRDRQGDFLVDARVRIRGDRRDIDCAPCRLSLFTTDPRGDVLPVLRGSADDHFLFDGAGRLVAVPVERRVPGPPRERWRRDDAMLLPATRLAALVRAPQANAEPALVPLPPEEESCPAWLGVEVQGLDRDLAQANGVSHLTANGKSGVLVSYVYDDSPAREAGLEPGFVLLRLQVPGRPRPVDLVQREERPDSFSIRILGADAERRYQESRPGYLPWPSAEHGVNRALSELGVGTPFVLEYAVAGQVRSASMRVSRAPPHHEVAPLLRSEEIGATVRDLTYEVRRHFRMERHAPGVIVSDVERGSRAAVAGLRRFDLVLRIDDRPVTDAAAFGRAASADGDLRLIVKDRVKDRVVRIAAASR